MNFFFQCQIINITYMVTKFFSYIPIILRMLSHKFSCNVFHLQAKRVFYLIPNQLQRQNSAWAHDASVLQNSLKLEIIYPTNYWHFPIQFLSRFPDMDQAVGQAVSMTSLMEEGTGSEILGDMLNDVAYSLLFSSSVE